MTDVEIAFEHIEELETFSHMLPPLELLDQDGIPYIEPLEID